MSHDGDDFTEEGSAKERASHPGWRRWLLWLRWLSVLLLVTGAVYVWWRGRQRNLAKAENQVRQAARLELRALSEGEDELYLSLQDPFGRSWKKAQLAYLDTHGLPLPLHDLTIPISTAVESARVIGERAQAEIVHTATLPSGDEGVFRAVRFYRYTSDGRWLHTRAEPSLVGEEVTFVVSVRGSYESATTTVSYPSGATQDIVIGGFEITTFGENQLQIDPLARSLAALSSRFCNLISCHGFLPAELRFDPSADAMAMASALDWDTTLKLDLAADLEEVADPEDAIFPAPVLVGAPHNEAAQVAWEASLGEFFVDYLVSREIEPHPREHHHGALFEERLRA